jgi:hypothetical protein
MAGDAGAPYAGASSSFGISRRGVLLRLKGAGALAPRLALHGIDCVRKRELHVTLLGNLEREGARLGGISAERLLAAARGASRGLSIEIRPRRERRLVREGERISVIQLVRAIRAGNFYARIEKHLGLKRGAIERPPYHVTLFVDPRHDIAGIGIGVRDARELRSLTRVLRGGGDVVLFRKNTARRGPGLSI